MKGFEDLKAILQDDSLHVGMGLIKSLHLASDRSYLKVTLQVIPEQRNIIATMTWDNTGTDSGDFEFPSVDDLVLFVNAEGDDDQAYVIRRLTSRVDTIPTSAVNGDKVHKAKIGKKYYNISDTSILLSRSDSDPTENLVLGQRFKAAYADHLTAIVGVIDEMLSYMDEFISHTHAGATVPVPDNAGNVSALKSTVTSLKNDIDAIKSGKIDNEFILSDLSYTEK